MVHLAHFLMLTVGSSEVLSVCVCKEDKNATNSYSLLLPLNTGHIHGVMSDLMEASMALQLHIVTY